MPNAGNSPGLKPCAGRIGSTAGTAEKRPKNAAQSWSHEEDAQICDQLCQGIDFNRIANTHNRSVAAILARLVKLGKITPEKSGHDSRDLTLLEELR